MNAADLSIEYSFLRLPYENAVKVFKISKKTVEKEMSSLLNQIIQLKNNSSISKQAGQSIIRQLLERLKELKQKQNKNYQEEENYYEICKKRLQHLNRYIKSDKQEQISYHKIRLRRIIIDYLVREGYYQTAEKMIKDYNLEELMGIEVELIAEANTVIEDLLKHQCTEALKWCQSNKSKLNRLNSSFEFKLIFQEFIELVKNQQIPNAISFIKKYSVQFQNNHFDDIKKAMGCLVVAHNLDKFPQYHQYFDESRWIYLIGLFKKEVYNIFSITTQPLLFVSLQAGISTLKTPYCYDKITNKQNDCPVCNKLVQRLAENVPGTQRHTSSIMCRISGEIMDEHNIPLALPNGQIYSQKALSEMAEKNDGQITCPTTKEKFRITEATKVFLT